MRNTHNSILTQNWCLFYYKPPCCEENVLRLKQHQLPNNNNNNNNNQLMLTHHDIMERKTWEKKKFLSNIYSNIRVIKKMSPKTTI
jgi:hypothetical protein